MGRPHCTSRRVLFKFGRGGQVSGELLKDKAPKTCSVFLASLPVELNLIHAMWAGEEIFCDDFPIHSVLEVENEVNEMRGGEVGLMSPLIHRHLPKKGFVPFCIFYGRGRARKSVDETVEYNVCAKIEGLETIANIGRRIRAQGIETVQIMPEV